MTWICPYCGQENWNEDRIAFSEPPCKKCRKERTTPEQLRKNLDDEKKQIIQDLRTIRPDVSMLREEIEEMESDLCQLKIQLQEVLQERKPYLERMKEIEKTVIYTSAERVIPGDQQKLTDLCGVTE